MTTDSRKKIHNLRIADDDTTSSRSPTAISYKVHNEFLAELFKESDRSSVIVANSYFEDLLLKQLKIVLSSGNKKARENLSSMNGPLATFSSRIDLLFCLGKISQGSWEDLHTLRRLRNFCAHNWQSFSFNQEVETNYTSKFNAYLNLSDLKLSAYTTRTQFILFSAYYAMTLNYINETK